MVCAGVKHDNTRCTKIIGYVNILMVNVNSSIDPFMSTWQVLKANELRIQIQFLQNVLKHENQGWLKSAILGGGLAIRIWV